MKKAVVLLSGGLDSATSLYFAKNKGFECVCLIFRYGQRHVKEIAAAKKIARRARCRWQVVTLSLPWKGSSLLDREMKIPVATTSQGHHVTSVPNTYVPARNIIFLSFALSYAEASGARTIFIGANAIDYSGYPDCRPEFYRAFVKAAQLGTKTGIEGFPIKIITPLITKTKARIIKLGMKLRVPYELTWSCYKGALVPCGECESCRFREKGFSEAGIEDPVLRSRK